MQVLKVLYLFFYGPNENKDNHPGSSVLHCTMFGPLGLLLCCLCLAGITKCLVSVCLIIRQWHILVVTLFRKLHFTIKATADEMFLVVIMWHALSRANFEASICLSVCLVVIFILVSL